MQAVQVINFDNIFFPGGNTTAYSYLSDGYQGFDWGGEKGQYSWVVSPNDATDWYGGTLQPYSHSGQNFAWTNGVQTPTPHGSSLQMTVHGGGTFDALSIWVRTWPNSTIGITAHGFLNGVESFSKIISITQIYSQLSLNFLHIDKLTIDQTQQSMLLDDIAVNNVSAVSEPSNLILMFGGLIGLGIGRSVRRQP